LATYRARSNKLFDHFSQAALFWRSQSAPEQEYRCRHCNFELGKVEMESIRKRMVACLLGSIVSWPRGADRGGFQFRRRPGENRRASIGVDQKRQREGNETGFQFAQRRIRVVRRSLRSRRRTKRRDLDMATVLHFLNEAY
jgi:hypothetical protein